MYKCLMYARMVRSHTCIVGYEIGLADFHDLHGDIQRDRNQVVVQYYERDETEKTLAGRVAVMRQQVPVVSMMFLRYIPKSVCVCIFVCVDVIMSVYGDYFRIRAVLSLFTWCMCI